jgi:hypothetical protein
MSEMDRLQKGRRDRGASPKRGRKTELRGPRECRGVERGISARLRHAGRIGDEATGGIREEPKQHDAIYSLAREGRWIRDRRDRVQRNWRLIPSLHEGHGGFPGKGGVSAGIRTACGGQTGEDEKQG